MGLRIYHQKCTGCGRCVDVCPGDLLYLNDEEKSMIRNQADCWDCMACVKSCPAGALETKLPFSLANFGASLRPEITEKEIHWICNDPDGKTEEFIIPRGL